MAVKSTKKPTGLTIKRSGNMYVFEWKIADSNYGDGQRVEYRFGNGKWESLGAGARTTKKSTAINPTEYFPYTKKKIKKVEFRVRGKRTHETKDNVRTDYNWSDWSTKTFTIKKPNKPTAKATLSNDYSNVTTFSWSVKASDSGERIFRRVKYQTVTVLNSNETDGSKVEWKDADTGTYTTTSGSRTLTNDSPLADESITRWVRFRSEGEAGVSEWTYVKHVYARPFQAKITSANAIETTAGGLQIEVKWKATNNAAHPIDSTAVRYSIVTPDADLAFPNGGSWTNANVSKDTGGADAAAFSLDEQLSDDQCLYVQVNTRHDAQFESGTTYGKPELTMVGNLKNPSGLGVVTDDTTYQATVSATNESAVVDAFLVVVYKTASNPEDVRTVGIIPRGETSVNVQCPDWSGETGISFGVYAAVGTATQVDTDDGTDSYAVSYKMRSADIIWDGGSVPVAPTNVRLERTDIAGTIRVIWDWTWQEADVAELSWADHPDAWESTSEPSTYRVSTIHASQWNISGLDTGKTWYVRVRLVDVASDTETASAWSEMQFIDLSSAPRIPVLVLSDGVIPADGQVTASWEYASTDGTGQAYAEVAQVTVEEGNIVYTPIAQAQTEQHVTIDAQVAGWESGNSYMLAVRVVSASGKASEGWSDPVSVIVAEPITIEISDSSLEEVSIVEDEGTREILALTEMPLTLTVEGAGEGGQTTVVIERAEPYYMDRPDEDVFEGHEGETIIIVTQTGEDEITIDRDDLVGSFDDGATYRIIATVQDGLGQSATEELEFEVRWSVQALIPTAGVSIEGTIAKITGYRPSTTSQVGIAMAGASEVSGTTDGDNYLCDIYRLSADKPELIVEDGDFWQTYVDPYPAIGENGGYRVVCKTINGDYITANNFPAWVDVNIGLESDFHIIDFDGRRVMLYYNVEVNNDFKKDFKQTKYLGGSVQGDWNAGINRSASIGAVAITLVEQDMIQTMRDLASYTGICHVRTREGSSYAADVQVSESRSYNTGHMVVTFSLAITRVDGQGLDGMTLEQWENS